jgi:hypothetical protein
VAKKNINLIAEGIDECLKEKQYREKLKKRRFL